MAGRSNTTLKKRQKEMARAEKQREKFAKRLEKEKGKLGDVSEMVLEDRMEEFRSDALVASHVSVE